MSDDAVVDESAEAVNDDFYSLGNTTDDAWRYKDYRLDYDDDRSFSAKGATSWIDKLLKNTTADNSDNKLARVEDVNPDNVLATLVFNAIVCVMLLGLYELLRRLIPSVYSQRMMHEREAEVMAAAASSSEDATAERQFVKMSTMQASGRSLAMLNGASSDDNDGEERGGARLDDDGSVQIEDAKDTQQHNHQQKEEELALNAPTRNCAGWPILEWALPVHRTPWSTFRKLAGLDAYFYLRYIRMCLKITVVSSFWAIVILCPVYATGGGDQSGFYHFSMANVLQEDKGRVWVPTFFCWAFTMYCWFCVRSEMIHYVELRMEFLGGEEEEERMRRLRQNGVGEEAVPDDDGEGGAARERVGYGAPSAVSNRSNGVIPSNEAGDDDTSGKDKHRGSSRSPLLAPAGSECENAAAPIVPALSLQEEQHRRHQIQQPTAAATRTQKEMKQHRYSLQVEKVPVALRSNTALFQYFNQIFPGQVHSASIAMNVPDLDQLSARRMRVCRRLEKSLAYYNVTGIRPTHVAGRPRFKCCGIESTPIDGWCVACCCFYDSCRMRTFIDDDEDGVHFPSEADMYEHLPDKGEIVDSISYVSFRALRLCLLPRSSKSNLPHFSFSAVV